MLLEITNETLEYPNQQEAIEKITAAVEQKLADAGLHYSHFIVDGQECYDPLEDYLQDNIHNTDRVTIVAHTFQELAQNILLTAHDYISGALPAVEELAEEFYQGAQSDAWHNLSQLLEGMQWLMESFTILDSHIKQEEINQDPTGYDHWENYMQTIYNLKEMLGELEQAINAQDLVLIGDLLTYELMEILAEAQNNLKNMLPWEG